MSPSTQPTPKKSSFFDFLKPRYHEAVYRLRNSVIAVIALATLTHLLPIPTPYASAWKFYRDTFQSPWEKGVAITGAEPSSPTHKLSNNKHSQNYSSSVSSSQTSSNPPSQSALHPHHTRPYPHPQKPSLHHASKPQARTGAVSATITSPPDSLRKCVFLFLPFIIAHVGNYARTRADDPTASAALLRVHNRGRRPCRQRVGPTRSRTVLLARIHQFPRVAYVAIAIIALCPTRPFVRLAPTLTLTDIAASGVPRPSGAYWTCVFFSSF